MKTRIRELRKQRKLTLRELDEQVNINYSQLARIERGESFLTQQHVIRLAEFFGVSTDYLLCLDTPENLTLNEDHLTPLRVVDTLEQLTSNQYTEYLHGYNDNQNAFFLQAHDDSMAPTILSGDYVLVEPNESVNQALVVVSFKNAVLIRRLKEFDGKKILVPDNPKYDIIVFDKNSKIKVVGSVNGLYRKKLD